MMLRTDSDLSLPASVGLGTFHGTIVLALTVLTLRWWLQGRNRPID